MAGDGQSAGGTKLQRLRRDVVALGYALRDPRSPWYARLLILAVVAYAVSPIDLIPDFIPVLGYLDDLVVVPLGVSLAIKCLPRPVIADARIRAGAVVAARLWWLGAILVLVLWAAVAVAASLAIAHWVL